MRIRNFVLTFLLVAATASAGIIGHHLYVPTSLPSAQGWNYQSSGLDEAEVFTIIDGVLVMDTMGSGFGESTRALYQRDVAYPGTQSAVFRVRARVTDHQDGGLSQYRGFGIGGHTPGLSWLYLFGLDESAIHVNRTLLRTLDTSVWHDYTVITEGQAPDSRSTLLVDGEVIVVAAGEADGIVFNEFVLGDLASHANARAEISEMEITVFAGAPVAVEATSLSAVKALFSE